VDLRPTVVLTGLKYINFIAAGQPFSKDTERTR